MVNAFIVFIKFLGWIIASWVRLVTLIRYGRGGGGLRFQKRGSTYINENYNNFQKCGPRAQVPLGLSLDPNSLTHPNLEREREREMCVCWGGREGGVRNPFILPKRTHLSLAYHDKMKKRPNLDLSLTKQSLKLKGLCTTSIGNLESYLKMKGLGPVWS